MQPGQYSFTLIQGASDGLTVIVKDAGVPVDLTGYSAEMQVRRDYDKPPILTASTVLGNIVIDPLAGKISVSFLPTDTSVLRFPGESLDAVYAIEITSPDGHVTRVIEGSVSISREVVR